jgi:hypothetical protein
MLEGFSMLGFMSGAAAMMRLGVVVVVALVAAVPALADWKDDLRACLQPKSGVGPEQNAADCTRVIESGRAKAGMGAAYYTRAIAFMSIGRIYYNKQKSQDKRASDLFPRNTFYAGPSYEKKCNYSPLCGVVTRV